MKVVIFGATGMVGQGVLRECLLAPDVESVLSVGRNPTGQRHDKLREIIHRDFTDFGPIQAELTGHDACFFCLGVSSVGMNEADYRRITYDFTLAAARVLAARNPSMTFVYVSGAGTGNGRSMWSRVKAATENALVAMPFRAYAFRPGFIQPMHGVTSRTPLYRVLYRVIGVFTPLVRRIIPNQFTTTERLGRAMLHVAREGSPKRVLETRDINMIGASPK
jgi:uncharacterized protein YbjT (DUF2867 family)